MRIVTLLSVACLLGLNQRLDAQVTYDLTGVPSPILLGKTLTGIVDNANPALTADDTVSWRFVCATAGGGYLVELEQPDLEESYCAKKVGMHKLSTIVQAPGGAVTKHVDIEVLGPTGLGVVSPANLISDTGPPYFTLEQRFRLVRSSGGTNTPIGACYTACAMERAALYVNGVWENEPTEWQHTGCSSSESPQFYFQSPDIVDTKMIEVSSTTFSNAQVGDIFVRYRQRVGVVVAKCDGNVEMTTNLDEYHVKKNSSTTIKHEIQ